MRNLILISIASATILWGQDRSVIFNTSNPAYTCNIAGGSYSNYTCDDECENINGIIYTLPGYNVEFSKTGL